MGQYIDKSTLVAEIKRIEYETNYEPFTGEVLGKRDACKSLLSFLDTLEVKEVDLNKEIDRVWDNTSENFSEDGWKEFEDIAKHFFELGMAVSNKEQKGK